MKFIFQNYLRSHFKVYKLVLLSTKRARAEMKDRFCAKTLPTYRLCHIIYTGIYSLEYHIRFLFFLFFIHFFLAQASLF